MKQADRPVVTKRLINVFNSRQRNWLILLGAVVVSFVAGRSVFMKATLLVVFALVFLGDTLVVFLRKKYFLSRPANLENIDNDGKDHSELIDYIDSERDHQARLDEQRKPLLLKIRSTSDDGLLTETLLSGLGKALGVDSVVLYSFAQADTPQSSQQWQRKPSGRIDDIQLKMDDALLFSMATYVYNEHGGVLSVTDTTNPKGDLTKIELVPVICANHRSFLATVKGEGTKVDFLIWAAMLDKPREWSEIERTFLRTIVLASMVQLGTIKQKQQMDVNAALTQKLEVANTIKNKEIANISHELRQPLSAIMGYLEILEDDLKSDARPGVKKALDIIKHNSARLQTLIENRINIAQLEENLGVVNIGLVNISDLINTVIASLQLTANTANVNIIPRFESQPSELTVEGDPGKLEQVLINLVANAIKFSPNGGVVTISAKCEYGVNDNVVVQVTDTGIGIPQKEIGKIFTRSYRASTATNAGIAGFGWGLAIVYQIVQDHHGTISARSQVGYGSTFTVSLPTKFWSK
jgi:signal transduction histidine kinase